MDIKHVALYLKPKITYSESKKFAIIKSILANHSSVAKCI